jgi:hypothetical protein
LKPDASGDVEKGYVGGEPTYPDQDATRPLKRVDEK